MPPAAIAVAALAVAAVGTGASIYEGQKAASAQRGAAAEQAQANELQRQQADLQAARTRRDAIRTARISAAQAENNASNQGVSDSSSAQGGVGSINSQLDSNLSFLDQYNYASDQASVHLGNAAQFESQANQDSANAQSFGQLSGAALSIFGNSDKIGKVFGTGG